MVIAFDARKRDQTLADRGLDFPDARTIFADLTYDRDDERKDYRERRVITASYLASRMMIFGWTPRGEDRHVFSMRKANDREKAEYGPLIHRPDRRD